MKPTQSLIAAAIAGVFAAGSVAATAAPILIDPVNAEKEACPGKDKDKDKCPGKDKDKDKDKEKKEEKKEGTLVAETEKGKEKEKEKCPGKDGCPGKEKKKEGTAIL